MAQLVVRNIENDIKKRLKERAQRHGRSMEEEARDILRDAVKDEARREPGFGTLFASYFKGIGLEKDEEITELRGEVWAHPVDFSGKEFAPKKKKKKA